MARGISITPLTDIFPRDIQQLEGSLNTTFHGFINQFKTGSAINTNAIISTLIAAGAVTTEKLATDAVTAAKMAAGSTKTSTLVDDAVTSAKIAAGNVKTSTLAVDAITSAKIAAANVKNSTIATGAITGAQIEDAALHKSAFYALEGCRVGVNGGSNNSTVTVGLGYVINSGAFVTIANASVALAGVTAATTYLVIAKADGGVTLVKSTSAPATAVALATIVNTADDAAVSAPHIGNSARFALARY